MSQISDSILKAFFHIICFCVTIYFTQKCVRDYLRDDDVTQLEFRKFNQDASSIYPSITYCMAFPITWDIKQFRGSNTAEELKQARKDYMNFALGKKEVNISDRLEYDDITFKLEHYLKRFSMTMGNTGKTRGQSSGHLYWFIEKGELKLKVAQKRFIDEQHVMENEDVLSDVIKYVPTVKPYISHRGIKEKCFTFDVPFISDGIFKNYKVSRVGIMLKPEILNGHPKNGKINGTKLQDKNLYSMYFHFPHQKLRAQSSGSGFKSVLTSADYYTRKYHLSSIEVLRRRDKPEKPCIKADRYGLGYDEKIMERTIEKIGCKPPTIHIGGSILSNETKLCNETENREFKKILTDDTLHPPPCVSILSMSESHAEEDQTWMAKDNPPWNQSVFNHEIYFQNDEFKDIEYLRKYTDESLMGNVGGVIG